MKVRLNSGYSSMDGSTLWVRDSAFDTAAPDDALILWDSEQGYEYGDGDEYTFSKKHLQFVEFDPDYEQADDLYEEPGLSDTPIVNGLVKPPTPADSDIAIGDNVLITLRGVICSIKPNLMVNLEPGVSHNRAIVKDMSTIRVLPKPPAHPAPGTVVDLTVSNANGTDTWRCVLSANGMYYGIGTSSGVMYHTGNTDIVKVDVIETL